MHKILVFLLKAKAIGLSLWPRKIFLFWGVLVGYFLYLISFRKKIAAENIQRAYPDWSKAQRAELLRKNYEHYGILFLEMLRSFWRFSDFLHQYCDVAGRENLQAALAKGKGVLVMTAHSGSWELLTATGQNFFQYGTTMVTKKLKPDWLHDFVVKERASFGVKMACEPRTMPIVMRALKAKEIVGFVMDQYTGAPVGARVPFFGIPVGSHTALATIALRTEAVVVPAVCFRKKNGRYCARFEPALETIRRENVDQAILENTAKYVSITERWVRECPEQWMWIHRRWKGDLSPLPPNSVGEFLR